VEIGDDLSLELGSRDSRVSGTEGDPGCPSGRVFQVDQLLDGGQTSRGSGIVKTAGWIE